MPVSQEVGALLATMIKRPLWVVLNARKASSAEMEPYVTEHLQYMSRLEEQGLLWASGPFIEPGVVVGDGLTIFNVAEEADVHRLMAEEPLVKRGLRSYSVRKWEVREGKISIELFLSQSRFALD
ncbi:YciI family protein [Bradyrhizobium sp. SK17]|uniref:YciI family protein n=1 Tax=Bradyrhizobium sp. SK17 TaxID=2057741 RepID=UPI0012FD308B|nr:YciI family protein [Bradyrhizobium sp. SK17]